MIDRNLVLAFALSFAVMVLWTMWQGDPSARAPQPAGTVVEAPAAPAAGSIAQATPPPSRPVPSPTPSVPPPRSSVPARTAVFERDLYRAVLTTRGGGIEKWELIQYDAENNGEHVPIVLADASRTGSVSLATPFSELGLGDLSEAIFELSQPNANTFEFLYHRGGIAIRKIYTFGDEAYQFRLSVSVENLTAAAITPHFAIRWPAAMREELDFKEQALIALHDGGVEKEMLQSLGQAGFLGGITGQRAESVITFPGDIDWAGVDTNYFLEVLIPATPTQANARFVAVEPGSAGFVEVDFGALLLPAGQSASREFRGYIGPKEIVRLERLGAGTDRAIDLGWSWFAPLTRFFGWMLRALHSIIPNYGWDIILLTILVRLVTAPLTTRQMRSMERMRALQPKLKGIQEKHKDDKKAASEAMMKLYKTEKVNPLGGCFPILLQMPVFIGLFYALRGSIELRQAPFFGWINDLSAPETLFDIPGLELPVRILPLLMGASMAVQTRMTPQASADPAQAAQMKMMTTVMPVVMTFVFYQFPSGLVLYWMVSNVLGISHQLWIRRHMPDAQATLGVKAAGGRSVRSEK